MAITRAKKEQLVAKYVDVLSQSDGFIVAQYSAMTVAETEQLRHKMRENSGEYMVTKNTLLKIALEQAEWPVPEDLLTGMVGVAFSKGNLPGMAKSIIDFAKDYEGRFVLKGGVMGTNVFGADDIKAVSELPTLDELYPQILGLLVQPSQNLVNVVHQGTAGVVNVLPPATSGIVNVLAAYIKKLEEGEGDAA